MSENVKLRILINGLQWKTVMISPLVDTYEISVLGSLTDAPFGKRLSERIEHFRRPIKEAHGLHRCVNFEDNRLYLDNGNVKLHPKSLGTKDVNSQPGQVTPQMIHSIFWRMLRDSDGITVKGDFFKDAPVDQKFEVQYDEPNDVWRFFVRTQRNRKKVMTPNRKVIT